MQNIRRSIISSRSRWSGSFRSFVESKLYLDDFALAAKRFSAVGNSNFTRQYVTGANNMSKGVLGATGIPLPFRGHFGRDWLVRFQASVPHIENHGSKVISTCFARSFASRTSKQSKETSETRKELSNVEDPFDAPTYNIPDKPVTFTEGASYSLIILVGLGIAAAAGYAVFKELIFQPKEYKIFNQALERIQNESQVRVRIGHPITGYGQETRNRAARQRIPNRIYTDENGVEHVEVNFYIRGPHGAGKVFAEMFKDKTDNKWKYTYLIVQINSPSRAELMLESYLPAAEMRSSTN
ncbi:hypothetical protein ERO13_D08G068700v2 [Gossypium hirsutum]|uniref:Mitochondrial import inner membrane translocase subunit Tim21 n=6 Tax=Gossypium TaxID=3633 RepID=A0A1U8KFX3_GOSHI|nr:probable mitochondrial import inner membrane translocase subunit TIM21 [Gossypium hirsutum]KAB2016066.1 hypothetical protein ES319_D08G071000v1 [Gossypium barbadense]TYG56589.1 hypothetical protein ES288_D08G075600v1 [Gossypium darwinii]TYH57216.1 hypothetical protein ES332_D08G074300v1 [Gossypium tomentosum]TYI68196.1 hypothetical protein E1A91_D08G072900v1 [Gossypium mustelinum]KAG4133012.1 hypothetical protein ERO13_D08G068700v2 [Gossypium hirsutum]